MVTSTYGDKGTRDKAPPVTKKKLVSQKKARLNKELKSLAVENLAALLEAEDTPAAVRAQSARTLLESLGYLGNNRVPLTDDSKAIETMSETEIAAEIAADGDDK
jgi:hypothetical protein